jgi:hypothetical protein
MESKTMTLTINIAKMQSEIEAHIAADAVRGGGHYWDGHTGCFIGCLAHDPSGDATALQEKYGLPEPLVRICEGIFERLPAAERPVFFREVGQAIGRDLTRVHWAFLADTLRHLPKTDAQHVVDPVIAGMDLLAQGKEWAEAKEALAAAEAAEAAWAAARAAEAAVRAAWAAARAARAVRAAVRAAVAAEAEETQRQRNALLRLLKAA